MSKSKGVFIERTKIEGYITSICEEQYKNKNYKVSPLAKVGNGNASRCKLIVDNMELMLDFFFNKDGSTTISPKGKNIEASTKLKIELEDSYAFKSTAAKSHTFKKVSHEWGDKLISYMSSLENVSFEKVDTNENQERFVFKNGVGDTLTVNRYKTTGTLLLQGKAAYLYREALSFLSHCQEISLDDVISCTNVFHNVEVNSQDIDNELQYLLPNAYDKIDDTIIKLLSPSLVLMKVNLELSDYSCYVFPVLKALEGYIKFLFTFKKVKVGDGFGDIFRFGKLTVNIATLVDDELFQEEIEKLYDHWKNNRHTKFHTNQKLNESEIIDREMAHNIINTTLQIIESSYNNIFNKVVNV